MQGRLADPDGRVGPDAGEAHRRRNGIGPYRPDGRQAQGGGVAGGEGQGPLVDIDRPDGAVRGPVGQGAGDGPVPAPEVEQVAVGGGDGVARNSSRVPASTAVRGEDAPIHSQPNPEIREGQLNLTRPRGHLGVGGEVMAVGHPTSNATGTMNRWLPTRFGCSGILC